MTDNCNKCSLLKTTLYFKSFSFHISRLLKKKGIDKDRQKELKQERRTLKNRGYAANCRKKKETCYDSMSSLNDKLSDEIKCKQSQIKESKREREQLRIQYLLITKECEQLKSGEVAATTASLSTKYLPWRPWSEYLKRKKWIKGQNVPLVSQDSPTAKFTWCIGYKISYTFDSNWGRKINRLIWDYCL